MTAVTYLRISSEEQAKQGFSIAGQREAIKKFCDVKGLTIEAEYADDDGMSGKGEIRDRPKVEAAIEEVKRLRGALVVWRLDRLSRDAAGLVQLEKHLNKHHVTLMSVTQNIDTGTSAGWFAFWIAAGMGEFEVRQLGERTAMALRHMRKNGHRFSRHAPYGFRLVGTGEYRARKNGTKGARTEIMRLEPDPREQEAITLAVGLRAEDPSLSLSQISERLANAGHFSRKGNPMSARLVRTILQQHDQVSIG